MSYRIIAGKSPIKTDPNPFYITVHDDQKKYSLRTGNEHSNHDDTDNMLGVKNVMSSILSCPIDDIILSSHSPHGDFIECDDSERITSNRELYVFRKNMLQETLENSGIDVLGEAISLKSDNLSEYIPEEDKLRKFFKLLPLFFKNSRHYEIIIDGQDWEDHETLSVLLETLSYINLKNITSFYLANLTFTTETMETLCHLIKKSIITDLSMNGIEMDDSAFNKLIECISDVKIRSQIVNFGMWSCGVDDRRLKEIANVFIEKPVQLPRNARYMGRSMPNELINVIETRSRELEMLSIKTIDLSDNEITVNGVDDIIKLLQLSTLEELDISDNPNITAMGSYRILRSLMARKTPLALHKIRINGTSNTGDYRDEPEDDILDAFADVLPTVDVWI